MSYYVDLFLRPKQAVKYAYEHPSLLRTVFFVILGTLAGVLGTLIYFGTFFASEVITSLLGDILRLLVGGIILLVIALLFKRQPLNGQSFSRAVSLLSQLNVYGFFIFLVMGLILPAIAIPGLIDSTRQLNQGVIGAEEFQLAVFNQVFNAESFSLWLIPFFLIGFLLLLYGVYVLYLSLQTFLNTTALKTILTMIVFLLLQGAFLYFIVGSL